MSALIHWSVIPYWGVIHRLSSQRELSFFTQPSLTEVAEGILQHSLLGLQGQWEVKIGWSIHKVHKLVKIHTHVKHNVRFRGRTLRKGCSRTLLEFWLVGICCVLSRKHWGTHWVYVCVMHADTHMLISRHMVDWLTCSTCIIHNSDCLQKIVFGGKFPTSALCCNFLQCSGHATVEWQAKLQQGALPSKGALLALRQGY